MLSPDLAKKILCEALYTGGDFAELFCEDTSGTTLTLSNDGVEDASYTRCRGVGVRVLCGARCSYAYTADIGEEALLATARAAAAAFPGEKDTTIPLPPFRPVCYETAGDGFSGVNNAMRVSLLRRLYQAARGESEEITQVQCRYMDSEQRVLVINSEGLWASTRRPYTRLAVTAVASDGTESQTGRCAPGFGQDFSVYDTLDVEALGRQAARQAVTMLHAVECPAGTFPVVMDGGFGGVIFHEACGHSLEATGVARGNSEFANRLGTRIAAPCVTAVDDGTLAGEWGSLNGVDDEGTPARRTVLIENGILKSYLYDRANACRVPHPLTGSSRRESYAYAPTSRMTNTFLAPGRDDPEEMIATMSEGLYAKTLGGGSVNPLTGEFNFAVDEGYWVRDGKILCPVRGATLVGKGSDVLMKIDRVGPRMWMAQGMCGSVSGSIPVNVGQPRIRISAMTVGGKGGKIEG